MNMYGTIAGLVLGVVLSACQETQPMDENTSSTTEVMKDGEQDYLSREKERLKKLLSQFSLPLEHEQVKVDLSDLGAIYSEGYKVKDRPVRSIAYLFSHQDEHAKASDYLKTITQKVNTISTLHPTGPGYFGLTVKWIARN